MTSSLSRQNKTFFIPNVLKCCDDVFWVSLLEFIGLGALWTCLIWVVLFFCSRKFFFITSLIIFSSLFPPTSQEFLLVGIMDILDQFYNFIFYFSSLFFSTFWKSSFITLCSHPFMLFSFFWLPYFKLSNAFLISVSFFRAFCSYFTNTVLKYLWKF